MAILRSDLFFHLLSHFQDLEFEARKEVMLIFAICLNYSKDNKLVAVDYFISQPRTINLMLRTVELSLQQNGSQDIFLVTGNMILECIKYEQLCRIILKDPQLWKFFDFARLANFEMSTESLQIINSAFTTHVKLVAKEFFINSNNVAKFIKYINRLMTHGSYVTKRQSTKLLASLVVMRSQNLLMNAYINQPENLKIIMTLMTDKSKNLQFDAFNIFKVMMANPKKQKPIQDILMKNREKLLMYFETFGLDIQDPMFMNERAFIIQEIENIPRLVQSSNSENNTINASNGGIGNNSNNGSNLSSSMNNINNTSSSPAKYSMTASTETTPGALSKTNSSHSNHRLPGFQEMK